MKKEIKNPVVKKIEIVKKPVTKKVTQPKIVKIVKPEFIPMQIEVIKSEKVERTVFPKYEILTKIPLPEGYIRCIVVKDYNGMLDVLRAGDIIDLPDRRYKSLSFRGLVTAYKGDLQPNKNR